MGAPGSARPDEPDIDWPSVRAFFKKVLSRSVAPSEASLLDDLVQESCIRLLIAARHESPRNLEALSQTIAQRTWVDFVRRRARWRALFEPEADDQDQAGAVWPEDGYELGDLQERMELVVAVLLDRDEAGECRQLSAAFHSGRPWKSIAEELGLSYEAVRKRWSRCLAWIRGELARDPLFAPLVARR